MGILKFGDVVKVLSDKEVFTGYDKGTLAVVVDVYTSGDKVRYRIADSKCKWVMDGFWYDAEDVEFIGRNIAKPSKYRRNT